MSMAFEVVTKKITNLEPSAHIQVYTRGTINFNMAAFNIMRGWTGVLLLFDRETRILRMVRDVSLKGERAKHYRKITKSGQTICVTARNLLKDFGVIEQHNVKYYDHGPNFIEFGPLVLEGDENDPSSV